MLYHGSVSISITIAISYGFAIACFNSYWIKEAVKIFILDVYYLYQIIDFSTSSKKWKLLNETGKHGFLVTWYLGLQASFNYVAENSAIMVAEPGFHRENLLLFTVEPEEPSLWISTVLGWAFNKYWTKRQFVSKRAYIVDWTLLYHLLAMLNDISSHRYQLSKLLNKNLKALCCLRSYLYLPCSASRSSGNRLQPPSRCCQRTCTHMYFWQLHSAAVPGKASVAEGTTAAAETQEWLHTSFVDEISVH